MLDLILFLKSVPLFREMSFEDIARIADKTEKVAVAEGEVLFEGGESITHVHIVRAAESLLLRLPVSIISDLVAENPQSLGPVVGDLMRRVNLLHARLASLVRRPAGSQQSRSSIDGIVIA